MLVARCVFVFSTGIVLTSSHSNRAQASVTASTPRPTLSLFLAPPSPKSSASVLRSPFSTSSRAGKRTFGRLPSWTAPPRSPVRRSSLPVPSPAKPRSRSPTRPSHPPRPRRSLRQRPHHPRRSLHGLSPPRTRLRARSPRLVRTRLPARHHRPRRPPWRARFPPHQQHRHARRGEQGSEEVRPSHWRSHHAAQYSQGIRGRRGAHEGGMVQGQFYQRARDGAGPRDEEAVAGALSAVRTGFEPECGRRFGTGPECTCGGVVCKHGRAAAGWVVQACIVEAGESLRSFFGRRC